MSTGETMVFLAVIGARFLVPLLIPRFPLPAIFASASRLRSLQIAISPAAIAS